MIPEFICIYLMSLHAYIQIGIAIVLYTWLAFVSWIALNIIFVILEITYNLIRRHI
jgi:hypothetical protein